MHAFRRLKGFEMRHDGALHAYLRQAVINRIRDEVRRAQRRPPPEELEADQHTDSTASPLESAIGTQAGGHGNHLGTPFRITNGKRDGHHASQTRTDEGYRLAAARAVQPGRDEIGETRDGNRGRLDVFVESAPGGPVAGPARTKHRVPTGIDQVRSVERWPPRLHGIVPIMTAEWKR